MNNTLHKNFGRALKKMYPTVTLFDIVRSIKNTGFELKPSKCICGHKIIHTYKCKIGIDNYNVDVGIDCIEDIYQTNQLDFKNLEQFLYKQCRGCDNFNIKKNNYKKIVKNYYCKNCILDCSNQIVKYKCNHVDVFDINQKNNCSLCIKKLWEDRLDKYKKTGIYEQCIDCKGEKQHDKHTKCNPCKIELLKVKEWNRYLDHAILTGIYSRCIECKKNKKADKYEKCYPCNFDKCLCGNYKKKEYKTCYSCKQLQ